VTSLVDSWPYLTTDLPACGGRIKSTPDDFVVEEIPSYPACGEGTHVYLNIEKRGLTTLEAVRRVARALGREPGDIGYAGMKDAQGVTRQRISVEHVDPQRVAESSIGGVRVLAVERHTNKLRIGHLAGNRFAIRLRGCTAGAESAAAEILAVLARRGVPNYFGPQRFGRRGTNARIGCAALAGDFEEALAWMLGRAANEDDPAERAARLAYDAGEVRGSAAAWPGTCRDEARLCRRIAERQAPAAAHWRSLDRRLRTLYYSAAQSVVFNHVLARRVGAIDQLLDGDIAWKHANGACFAVVDAAVEQPRCVNMEISPTGPIPGSRMDEPTGAPGELERDVQSGLGMTDVVRRTSDGIRLDGARRPLRVPLRDCTHAAGRDEAGDFLRLEFMLPAGAYATSVLREIAKNC